VTQASPPKPTVLFIVGATASGKTEAALSFAMQHNVEVVNADSRQVYRGMDIGTAKPTPEQLAMVPHHLIDVVSPDEPYNLALFLHHARSAIDEILVRGRLPVVTGGTGQYIWGLVQGWEIPQVPPQQELRIRLEQEAREEGVDVLHRRLRGVDAAAAEAIDPRNIRRVIRALEVSQVTGQPFSAQRRQSEPPFLPLIAGIWRPQEELKHHIDSRVDAMLTMGWLEEVRRLLDEGYPRELPSFSSAGYRELAALIQGELSRDATLSAIRAAVRRLARRQAAWFRREDPHITWEDGPEALVTFLNSRTW
jgi:tRNA dimethylallyltransferase